MTMIRSAWFFVRRPGILAGMIAGMMALSATASDGVVEINQASVLAGGGFPVTLSATGSYKLTSSLTVSNAADALVVSAVDVYVDLNGFSIIGPAGCSGSAPPVGAGSGIVSGAPGTTVVNGSIRGFGTSGVSLVDEGRVVDVRVRCAGSAGIRVGSEGRVERSTVRRAGVGIETGPTSLLVDNEVTGNDGFALLLGSGSAIRGNVLVGNNGGDSNPQIQSTGSFFELGPNRCGSGLTCTAGGICGNGQTEGGETCDDGNAVSGDGCSDLCQVESGFQCTGVPSVCVQTGVCGDGATFGAETCDDANTSSGDGCNAACQVEQGFVCTGQPSVCTSSCGDGILAGGEQCDGANFGGASCLSMGYSSGVLACVACQIDVSNCSL